MQDLMRRHRTSRSGYRQGNRLFIRGIRRDMALFANSRGISRENQAVFPAVNRRGCLGVWERDYSLAGRGDRFSARFSPPCYHYLQFLPSS